MIYEKERNLLAAVAQDMYRRHKKHLQRMKEEGARLRQQPDFLWHRLLGSFATWGSSGGWKRLSSDPKHLARLEYDALARLSPDQRHRQIREVFGEAGIRWPNKKARHLMDCFEQIERMGGPEEATELLFALEGAEAKRRFLMSLPGIGPSYARNMMMDAHHPDFRDTIAVDAGIERISQCLDLSLSNYGEEEAFYQSVAEEAGVSGWELDRLIYNYTDEFLEALGEKAHYPASQGCKPEDVVNPPRDQHDGTDEN